MALRSAFFIYLLNAIYLYVSILSSLLASYGRNVELQEKLWTFSESLVKEKIGA